MKRRLRQKLRLGEFQEFLFEAEMRVNLSLVDNDEFLNRWIEEIEANEMVCGGGGVDGKWSFSISCQADWPNSRAKCERIAAWLQATAGILEFTLSPIYADLTRAFVSSPRAATRQKRINRERGIDSKIWRD